MKDTENTTIDQENAGNSLVELIQVLQNVDIDSSEAKLNATTISDNKGGRIYL